MNEWSYVMIGWVSVVGGIAAYAASVVFRARRFATRVAPGQHRWMEAPE